MPRRNRAPQPPAYPAWESLWQIFCPWIIGFDMRMQPKKPRSKMRILPCLLACSLYILASVVQAADPVDANLVRISLQQEPQALFTHYPALFGKSETRFENLQPFTKWKGVLERFAEQLPGSLKEKTTRDWLAFLRESRDQDSADQIDAVNRYMNKVPFISDQDNYDVSDYWATPMEFMQRGGDCEDYAIAKYVSLRALGFKEEQLRVAIVYDTQLQMPHAVLIVYQNDEALVLDNQAKEVKSADNIKQYFPIYSINQYAWWRH